MEVSLQSIPLLQQLQQQFELATSPWLAANDSGPKFTYLDFSTNQPLALSQLNNLLLSAPQITGSLTQQTLLEQLSRQIAQSIDSLRPNDPLRPTAQFSRLELFTTPLPYETLLPLSALGSTSRTSDESPLNKLFDAALPKISAPQGPILGEQPFPVIPQFASHSVTRNPEAQNEALRRGAQSEQPEPVDYRKPHENQKRSDSRSSRFAARLQQLVRGFLDFIKGGQRQPNA